MVQRLFLLFFLTAGVAPLLGQQTDPIYSEFDTVRFRLQVSNQAIQLADVEFTPQGYFQIDALRLRGGDLEIQYRVSSLRNRLSAQTQLVLNNNTGIPSLPGGRSLGGAILERRHRPSELHTLTWRNFLEDAPGLGVDYQLLLTQQFLSDFKCSEGLPRFTGRQQIPHWILLGVGAGLMGVGQAYRSQRDTDYDNYRQNWENGGDLETADPLLQSAQDNDDRFTAFTWAGAGVLVGNAAWFTLRYLRVRARRSLYCEFCEPCGDLSSANLEFQPYFVASGPALGPFIGGATIQLTF